MCKDVLGAESVFNISTVDFVKEVATMCGWDGTKTPKNRKFLSDLKDLLTEWDDIPLKKIMAEAVSCSACAEILGKLDKSVLFIHCREPQEIEKLVRVFQDDVTTLLIRRSEAEAVKQINHADNDVFHYAYDYTIYNDSTLSWLRNEAVVFLRDYLKLDI
jgi:hypothetical protein